MKSFPAVALVAALCIGVSLSCSYTGPSGPIDLGSVPTATLQINQVYQGQSTPYTWVINLCDAVNQPPAGASSCTNGAGFISQFSPGACETAWPTQSQGWSYDPDQGAGTATFETPKGWSATVYVGCGATPGLSAAANVTVDDALEFTFMFTTAAACGGNVPTNTPVPPAPTKPSGNNGTVSRLVCKDSACRQCTGEVLPIGTCVATNTNGSEKALSCSSRSVMINSWASSTTCSTSFFPTKESWPVGRCIETAPGDYRFYTCSP